MTVIAAAPIFRGDDPPYPPVRARWQKPPSYRARDHRLVPLNAGSIDALADQQPKPLVARSGEEGSPGQADLTALSLACGAGACWAGACLRNHSATKSRNSRTRAVVWVPGECSA